MTNKQRKFFKHAKAASEMSSFPRVHIGAIVTCGNKVVGVGFNSRKSSPIQKKYNKYRNFYLKTEKESQEDLGEDTYYIVDLIGLDVYSDKNEYLGKIEDVFPTGSNDVYVVKDNLGKQILIPAIAEVVKKVDLKNKKMVIKIIPGLI